MKKLVFPFVLFLSINTAIIAGNSHDNIGKGVSAEIKAGQFNVTITSKDSGARLTGIYDAEKKLELLSAHPNSELFTIIARKVSDGSEIKLNAGSGWSKINAYEKANTCKISFSGNTALKGIDIEIIAKADALKNAIAWSIIVKNTNKDYAIRKIIFPSVSLKNLGDDAKVFYPQGPGIETDELWTSERNYSSYYPSGWCASMPFVAAYNDNTGIYMGIHDTTATVNYMEIFGGKSNNNDIRIEFSEFPANVKTAGNDFSMKYEIVWHLLRDGWYESAKFYRSWAEKYAKWWSHNRDINGRTDTPKWFKDLNLWMKNNWQNDDLLVSSAEAFQKYFGMPVGFHWYTWWKSNVFDNDYPHYFPPKPGFAENIKELQNNNIYVMPYINGRIWDTHDSLNIDRHFTSEGLAGAAKDIDGNYYPEEYNSKEIDGSKVHFAVMCPASKIWQTTQENIQNTLFGTYKVKGIYVDQVSATDPNLCYDPTHGHTIGGGSYWVEGYNKIFKDIRAKKSPDQIITSEANCDIYAKDFDGFLTWNWWEDKQVPAFPLVIAGNAITIGLNYTGNEIAMLQKTAQCLVYGTQLGWTDCDFINNKLQAPFLKDAALLRDHIKKYFIIGEMGKPLKLPGLSTVTGNPDYMGVTSVTTPTVMNNVWYLPSEKKLIIVFSNLSKETVKTIINFDASAYGILNKNVKLRVITKDGAGAKSDIKLPLSRQITITPYTNIAWEISEE